MKTPLTRTPIPKISLEQWAVFRAVVEEGSFALAAERLSKSQSGVSYAIAKLEARLPSPAFGMNGRKAELTDLGAYLYRQAVILLDQAHAIDRNTQLMAEGWEQELSIAADALTPMPRLFCALQTFSLQCPGTRVRILETTLSGTDESILERRVQLAISPSVPTGFLGEVLWSERMIPTVSAEHELARLGRAVNEQELRRHRQIVVRDSGHKREQTAGWLQAEQRWTVSHFSSSVEAVRAGLGFAFLPETRIREDLASGAVVEIPMEISFNRKLNLNLILTDQSESGPAAKALAEVLRSVH